MAKIMVGDPDYTGDLKLGHNVQIGYFAQNQAEHLDSEITLLTTMENAANDRNRAKVRDMLGSFLFRGEDVDKKVKVLSGGERNRLALCKMLLESFNVLIMDEPTNHLDIASKNALKQALNNFKGTLILVSHDRDFLQGLTKKVYYFKDKTIKEYLGDLDYFLEAHQLENMRATEMKTIVTNEKSIDKNTGKLNREEEKELKKLKNRFNRIERNIANLE